MMAGDFNTQVVPLIPRQRALLLSLIGVTVPRAEYKEGARQRSNSGNLYALAYLHTSNSEYQSNLLIFLCTIKPEEV